MITDLDPVSILFRELRGERTQHQAAAACGVAQSSICDFERGRWSRHLDALVERAMGLGADKVAVEQLCAAAGRLMAEDRCAEDRCGDAAPL